MKCRSIIKPVESPRGQGEVFLKGRLISRVSYNLDVLEEEFWTDPADSPDVRQNLEYIVGSIIVTEKGKRLHGTGIMTLKLRDDRRLDFGWQRSDPATPKYNIRSSGVFY